MIYILSYRKQYMNFRFIGLLTSIFAGLFAISILVYGSYQAYLNIQNINRYFFPILEGSSISLRLQEKLVAHANIMIYKDYDENEISTFLNLQNALETSLKDFMQTLEEMQAKNLYTRDVSIHGRVLLREKENQLIELLKNKKNNQAKNLFLSDEYQNVLQDYNESLQITTENILFERDAILQQFQKTLINSLFIFCLFLALSMVMAILLFAMIRAEKKRTKEVEENLEKEKLKTFQTAKLASLGEMAGGIAHEINTPLTVITVSAQMLETLMDNPEKHKTKIMEIIEKIDKTSFKISKITKSLRRLSTNEQHIEKESVLIKDIIDDVVSVCSFRNSRSDVKFNVHVPNEKLILMCKQVEISQILINLINNAHDAIEKLEHKQIDITVETSDRRIIMRVRDSGPNAYEKIHEKIMSPFFTTKGVKGTGLGLSISKKIAESYDGTLEMNPNSESTEFVLNLPNSNANQVKSA